MLLFPNQFNNFAELPKNAIVGTASLRRQCQIAAKRPDIQIKSLRGNVGTRLAKLDNNEYDAIILASAGLIRLELASRIKQALSADFMLPAAGQGAVGIECRSNDSVTQSFLAALNHQDTHYRVIAERTMSHQLQGGCQVPIAAYAQYHPSKPGWLMLEGLVGEPDGSKLLSATGEASQEEAQQLGLQVAAKLKAQGAMAIIDKLMADSH